MGASFVKAYIIKTEKSISPFEEHPRDLLILGSRLEDIQQQVLHDMKIPFERVNSQSEINDAHEHIFFYDNLYFTKSLLEEFILKSRRKNEPTVCALKKSILTLRSITATQDIKEYDDSIEYQLWYNPRSGESQEVRQQVKIDPEGSIEEFLFPHHILQEKNYLIPLTTKKLIQIDHWTNLWSCNIGVLLGRLQELKTAPKWKLLTMALRARSTNPWNVSKLNVKIGKGCDIHPAAYLENTEVGQNVKIGAGTVIRGCKIDDNVFIGNNATLTYSYLGTNSHIRDGCNIFSTALYPGAIVSNFMTNLSLIGRNAFIAVLSIHTDYRVDGKCVHVLKDGELVDTKQTFLGCCLGHDVYIGPGVIIAPGRAISNGVKIFASQERIIRYGNERDSSNQYNIYTD